MVCCQKLCCCQLTMYLHTKLQKQSLFCTNMAMKLCSIIIPYFLIWHLLPILKYEKSFMGRSFFDNEEVIIAVESWFASKSADFYQDRIKQLFHSCQKYMALGGGYVEKEEIGRSNFRSLAYLHYVRVRTFWPPLVQRNYI